MFYTNLNASSNPSKEAIAHSDKLLALITSSIEKSQDKFISFAEYMQLALYAPGLGYYSAGSQKFGASGDFVTAPEISSLFSQCLAQQCYEAMLQLEALGSGASGLKGGALRSETLQSDNLEHQEICILEVGAGSGQMALDILRHLQALGKLPKYYYILELSAELRLRQQQTLIEAWPEIFSLVTIEWLDTLPARAIKGIILANEVCDAMPVERFCIKEDNIFQIGVGLDNGKLCWQERMAEEELKEAIHSLLSETNHYISEINLNLKPWVKSLAEILENGLMLIIDYGFSGNEYYHHSRTMGTLTCHYRHQVQQDLLFYPGLQDITAHVDFTAIAEAALEAELQVLGFSNQASFLIASGLLTFAENSRKEIFNEETLKGNEILSTNEKLLSEKDRIKQNQAIQVLTSPAEMGELFKVMALGKNFPGNLSGFTLQDLRYQL